MKLACDIDETLSWTVGHLIAELQKKFGNPEKLSVQGIIDKYRYTFNVPYWQTPEVEAWVDKTIKNNDVQKDLPIIRGANLDGVDVRMYISVRPESVQEGTEYWLQKHGFPNAPVLLRPHDTQWKNGNAWKAAQLVELYPKIEGIIDDNVKLVDELEKLNYKGTVYLYSHDKLPETTITVISVKDWAHLREALSLDISPRKV